MQDRRGGAAAGREWEESDLEAASVRASLMRIQLFSRVAFTRSKCARPRVKRGCARCELKKHM